MVVNRERPPGRVVVVVNRKQDSSSRTVRALGGEGRALGGEGREGPWEGREGIYIYGSSRTVVADNCHYSSDLTSLH